MNNQDKIILTISERNRVLMWWHILGNVYESLNSFFVLCDVFRTKNLATEGHHVREFCKIEKGVSRAIFFSIQPLQNYAAIMFCHLYGSGKAGPAFVSDKDPNVIKLRTELENHVKETLKWSDKEYSTFVKKIKDDRNKFIAHYDRCAANYSFENGISVRNAPTTSLNWQELKTLKFITGAMHEYFQKSILPRMKTTDAICG